MQLTSTEDPVVREAPPADHTRWRLLAGLACGVVGLLVLAGFGMYILVRAPSAPRGAVDNPTPGATVSDPIEMYGWAADLGAKGNSGVDRVDLYVDGTSIGEANYGQARPDIATSFGSQFEASGWTARLDPQGLGLASGPHTLEMRAHSRLTGTLTSFTQAFVVKPPTDPTGHLDVPEDGTPVAGPTAVRGWALDQRAATGSGVDRVQLYVDGVLTGDAQTGLSRPDIAASFGAQFDASGWSGQLDPGALSPGQHTLEARAHSRVSGEDTAYTRTFVVPVATAPQGAIDLPAADGATLSGSVDVQGWAIDADADAGGGTGVDRVQLSVDGTPLGAADYGQARTEIGSAYGVQFTGSGFTGTVDLSDVPAGTHLLEARARSTLTGAETTYTARIVVAEP